MLRNLSMSLSLVLMAVLAVAPAAMAENKVQGPMDLAFNACWSGPSEEVPDWIGTIDLDGDVYDAIFYNVGTGWPVGQTPEAPFAAFNEIWAVYDGLELAFDDECAVETLEGDLVLWGHDAGLLNTETAEFEMSGTVMGGSHDFEGLAGDSVHMSGTVLFSDEGAPQSAPGEFSIS